MMKVEVNMMKVEVIMEFKVIVEVYYLKEPNKKCVK